MDSAERTARRAFEEAQEKAQDTVKQADGPQIRVLCCFECKSLEVMPDYIGNPEYDAVLHTLDERHGGHSQMPHDRTIIRVEKRVWDDRPARKQIIDRAYEGKTGFAPSYYDIKDTLAEDAGKCFVAHNRSVPCLDYKDSSKRLRAPTAKDRRTVARELEQAGMRNKVDLDRLANDVPIIYLCEFCPVQVAVDFKKRQERGEM